LSGEDGWSSTPDELSTSPPTIRHGQHLGQHLLKSAITFNEYTAARTPIRIPAGTDDKERDVTATQAWV